MVRTRSGNLRFEWDETKARANLRKHGLDFMDAPEMFKGVLFTTPDEREDYGEARWVGIGEIQGRVVVIVFTQPAPETIRMISLRKATRNERNIYEKAIQDELGKD